MSAMFERHAKLSVSTNQDCEEASGDLAENPRTMSFETLARAASDLTLSGLDRGDEAMTALTQAERSRGAA
jgi:hypothetical protein